MLAANKTMLCCSPFISTISYSLNHFFPIFITAPCSVTGTLKFTYYYIVNVNLYYRKILNFLNVSGPYVIMRSVNFGTVGNTIYYATLLKRFDEYL